MQVPQVEVLGCMGIPYLWDLGHHGKGVAVAVLDTGMTPNPRFTNRIAYDQDFTGEELPRHRSYRHGTRVAESVLHIAPEATIGNCKVMPTEGKLTRETVVRALRHCIDVFPRYKVVNISLSFVPRGCPDDCELCATVDDAYRNGLLVVAAAGNEGPAVGTLTCPALSLWCVKTVATWRRQEEEWWEGLPRYKQWWKQICGEFGERFGTSYSAGYASGAAAVLFSAFPRVDADTLRFAMLDVAETAYREKGHETSLRFDQVYEKLHWMQRMASVAGLTKPNALYPVVKPF